MKYNRKEVMARANQLRHSGIDMSTALKMAWFEEKRCGGAGTLASQDQLAHVYYLMELDSGIATGKLGLHAEMSKGAIDFWYADLLKKLNATKDAPGIVHRAKEVAEFIYGQARKDRIFR